MLTVKSAKPCLSSHSIMVTDFLTFEPTVRHTLCPRLRMTHTICDKYNEPYANVIICQGKKTKEQHFRLFVWFSCIETVACIILKALCRDILSHFLLNNNFQLEVNTLNYNFLRQKITKKADKPETKKDWSSIGRIKWIRTTQQTG